MKVRVIVVPYDTALPNFRMGAGPERLLAAGLVQSLEAAGHSVAVERITAPDGSSPAEIRTAFELNRELARRVRATAAGEEVPIILAGNCITAHGTLAGLQPSRCAVMWFDSHGDFNTPESTTGGFLDGMAIATVTGRCWQQLAASVEGHRPIEERDVVLLGTRDLDPLEELALNGSEVTVLSPERVRADLVGIVRELSGRMKDAYVHLDLDVLDPSEGRANDFAAPDGLRSAEVGTALTAIAEVFRIRAVALTAYDPSLDPDGRLARAAIELVELALRRDHA